MSYKGFKIEQTKSIKYLRVLLDDKLKWHEHIDYVANKLSAANGILCKFRRYVPQNALISVCYSLAYSYLQYAISCWEMLLLKSSINYKSVKTAWLKQLLTVFNKKRD